MELIRNFLTRLPQWMLTAVCIIAILWLTLASKPLGDNDIQLFPHADKVAHAIMFGGFAFCILIDCMRKHNWERCTWRVGIVAVICSVSLGIITEILQQSMHIGRSGDPIDLLADSAGAILTAFAFCCQRN